MARLRFREWPNADQARVEIRNVGSSRSYVADSLAVARRISEGGDVPQVRATPDADLGEYEEWDRRGWADALAFYIATLDRDYVDVGTDFRDRHTAILSTYASESIVPTERYPNDLECVKLPASRTVPQPPHGDLLRHRRSTLVPAAQPLDVQSFADIMNESTQRLAAFRTSEIGGNAQDALVNFGPSLDVYCLIYDVSGLPSGVYRYDLRNSSLIRISSEVSRAEARAALVGQPAPMTASVSVVYVSEVYRHQWRYRHPRALRGLWIDGAKVVNHLLWALARRRIVPHISPAVSDSAMCTILGIEPHLGNEILYAVSFGGAPSPDGA